MLYSDAQFVQTVIVMCNYVAKSASVKIQPLKTYTCIKAYEYVMVSKGISV